MQARLIISCLTLLSWALAASAQETDIDWHDTATTKIDIPDRIIVAAEELRSFKPTGQLAETKRLGSMVVKVRQGVYLDASSEQNQPASITVHYRNRLLAAASGYRLGSALAENGVIIESWPGTDNCSFTRWRLEFAGERMSVTSTERFRSPSCTN